MKSTLYIEYLGKQLDDKSLYATVKDLWVNAGNKVKDIDTLNLYIKPEENTVYYVINEDFSGSFSM